MQEDECGGRQRHKKRRRSKVCTRKVFERRDKVCLVMTPEESKEAKTLRSNDVERKGKCKEKVNRRKKSKSNGNI